MIAVAWILHVIDEFQGRLATIATGIVTASWVMLIVTEGLRKSWTVVAADFNRPVGALLISVLLSACAITTLVLFILCLNSANHATGIVAIVFWQLVINVSMVTGLLPVVGIPLVMMSYGGSSIVMTMAGMGLLMNISMRRFMFQ